MDVARRNDCMHCRLRKCLAVGMKKVRIYYIGRNHRLGSRKGRANFFAQDYVRGPNQSLRKKRAEQGFKGRKRTYSQGKKTSNTTTTTSSLSSSSSSLSPPTRCKKQHHCKEPHFPISHFNGPTASGSRLFPSISDDIYHSSSSSFDHKGYTSTTSTMLESSGAPPYAPLPPSVPPSFFGRNQFHPQQREHLNVDRAQEQRQRYISDHLSHHQEVKQPTRDWSLIEDEMDALNRRIGKQVLHLEESTRFQEVEAEEDVIAPPLLPPPAPLSPPAPDTMPFHIEAPSTLTPSFSYHRAVRSPSVEAIVCEPEMSIMEAAESTSPDTPDGVPAHSSLVGEDVFVGAAAKDASFAFPASLISISRRSPSLGRAASHVSGSTSTSDTGSSSEDEDGYRYAQLQISK